jgi:hypothetical protein
LSPHHGARCPDSAKNRKRKWGEKPGSQLQLLKVFAEVQSRQAAPQSLQAREQKIGLNWSNGGFFTP